MDSNTSTAGGRRNRGRGKRNANRRHNNSNSTSGATGGTGTGGGNKASKGSISGSASGGHVSKKIPVPPPPQVKLTLRHIGNPIAFGTTKAVLEGLVIPLVEACNAKALAGTPSSSASGAITASTSVTTNTSFFLEFDLAAKRHLIEEEEAAQRYSKEWKQQQADKHNLDEEPAKAQPTQSKDEEKDEPSESLEVIVAPPSKAPPNVPVITFRPLYVVPPKKTRRRGDRPGVAYILLTAPKIEKIEIPATVPEHGIPKSVPLPQTTENLQSPLSIEGSTEPVLPAESNSALGSSGSGETPHLTVETSATVPTAICTTAPSSTASIKKSTDYSRHVAQGRLLLQNAIDMLINLTSLPPRQDGSKGQPQPSLDGAGAVLQVETSMSGKTWRWQYGRPDRREGTIESTADYKNWMATLEKQQAELKSRPKPTPGGGYVASSEDSAPGAAANAGGGGTSSGQPIAALVQHLRAKQQDLKRKKAKKKKETPPAAPTGATKDTKKQSGKGAKNTKKAKPTNKSDAKVDDPEKKKPKKPTKKKGIGGGKNNTKAVAPTTLLKANSAS